MNIVKATARYEDWLRSHTTLVDADLRLKHKKMAESAFSFLRAIFYRWVQIWPRVLPELAEAPQILAVGDLHVENFGTWRDLEGRLIWGVNDFDEAAPFSYANDLVRLAASALLAIEENRLAANAKDVCAEILEGYTESLSEGGRPFVLEEGNKWLRSIALNELRNPDRFWKKMDALPLLRGGISPSAREALEHTLPRPGLPYRLARRVAGLGSLGRQRLVAIADFHGGKIAREAKMLVPSAAFWAATNLAARLRSGTRLCSRGAYVVPIPSCCFVDVGSSDVFPRTVPASSWPTCPAPATSAACCSLWDGKPLTYTSATATP